MIRTIKEEFLWLREWENLQKMTRELNKWVNYYNRIYIYSTLGYRTPAQVEQEYYRNHASQKTAA
jgi:transposase InsO family protein